jgi:hypothetical protein
MSRAEHWLVSLALGLLFVLLLLAVLLLAGGLGVRYGVVAGPTLNIDLGQVRIVASTNQAPNCNPADPACAAQQPLAGGAPRFYSLWVVTSQKVVTSSGGPEQFGGTRVWALQAGP